MRTVIIDNYDSFTFNLFQMVAGLLPQAPIVIRNDEMDWAAFVALEADCVIISPGPGRPDRHSDFGLSGDVLRRSMIPTLGVCLGHQGICHAFGGQLAHAPEPMHGRIDSIHHSGEGLFAGIPSPFSAVRYHSLLGLEPLPEPLQATAWTGDGLLMGLAHRTRPIWGVQFHPESICTDFGATLLKNFLDMARPYAKPTNPAAIAFHSQPAATEGKTREVFVQRLAAAISPDLIFETLFGPEEVAVWLDSARSNDSSARFSFMAGGALRECELVHFETATERITIERQGERHCLKADFFDYMKTRLGEVRVDDSQLPFGFTGGWVGYLGYEMKAVCGGAARHPSSMPDSSFLLVERFVAFDHLSGELYLVFLGEPGGEAAAAVWFEAIAGKLSQPQHPSAYEESETIRFRSSHCREAYLSKIEASLGYIRDGETYELCLTNQLKAQTSLDPLAYYYRLRQSNPAPYAAFLRFPDASIASSSPERFLQVTKEGQVETKPIKGTIKRGQTEAEDATLRHHLANDVKSRSENLMIVDLLRNDLGRVCEVGSVRVPGLLQIESYATVHQMVSTIRGQLRPGLTAVDCLRSAFPGGSMTGAPKLRTLEIIDTLETEARGVYSGCLGYLAFNGSADFNIVIRTAVFKDQQVSIGVGGAIIALSDPQSEWEEMLLKAEALLRAFGPHQLDFGPEADLMALAKQIGSSVESPLPVDPLAELRGQLDAIDHQLLAMLGRRFDVCRQVAELKSQLTIPMMQPGRIQVVQERAAACARKYGYGEEFASELYRLIVGEACRIEDELISDRAQLDQTLP